MADVTFTAESVEVTVQGVNLGFTSGFIVIRHEFGKPDAFATRPFQTREEAEARVEKLRAKPDNKPGQKRKKDA